MNRYTLRVAQALALGLALFVPHGFWILCGVVALAVFVQHVAAGREPMRP